jgi:hypothetical protein
VKSVIAITAEQTSTTYDRIFHREKTYCIMLYIFEKEGAGILRLIEKVILNCINGASVFGYKSDFKCLNISLRSVNLSCQKPN